MSTSMATTTTSLFHRALFPPRSDLSASSVRSLSSRSNVVIPRAVAKRTNKASVSVSTKKGGRFASSKVTAADGNFRDVIEDEIEALQESGFAKKAFDFPKFPFEVIDNPGDQVVILKRELNGETIKVIVFPDFDGGPTEDEGEEDVDDEDLDEEDEAGEEAVGMGKPGLSVTVTVEKGEGPFLEFICSFGESGFFIENLAMKKGGGADTENTYLGRNFVDLDEGLQDALERYLEVRGVRNPMFNVLTEYMMNKELKEYLRWLKNMKGFISK